MISFESFTVSFKSSESFTVSFEFFGLLFESFESFTVSFESSESFVVLFESFQFFEFFMLSVEFLTFFVCINPLSLQNFFNLLNPLLYFWILQILYSIIHIFKSFTVSLESSLDSFESVAKSFDPYNFFTVFLKYFEFLTWNVFRSPVKVAD